MVVSMLTECLGGSARIPSNKCLAIANHRRDRFYRVYPHLTARQSSDRRMGCRATNWNLSGALKDTLGTVKLLLPFRQSRGIIQQIRQNANTPTGLSEDGCYQDTPELKYLPICQPHPRRSRHP